jgi:hypothetical protein
MERTNAGVVIDTTTCRTSCSPAQSGSCVAAAAEETVLLADRVLTLGYGYATRAGISISIKDMAIPEGKHGLLDAAQNGGSRRSRTSTRAVAITALSLMPTLDSVTLGETEIGATCSAHASWRSLRPLLARSPGRR